MAVVLNVLDELNMIKSANDQLKKLLEQSYPGTDQRLLRQALDCCYKMQSRDSYISEKLGKIKRLLQIYLDHNKSMRFDGGHEEVKNQIDVLQSLIDDQLAYLIRKFTNEE
jgi:hypothetical protein